MAVLWATIKNGVQYEVRCAGGSMRLYTDGVFHTQWNPSRPLCGHVWDLLFLSSCFLPVDKTLTNTLVLGVGGGAVINSLKHFYSNINIDGVDLDETHLQIARKYFIENSRNIILHHTSAEEFIVKNCADKYDLIIEDLFMGIAEKGKSEARKAVDVNLKWLNLLMDRLNTGGVLALNFESMRQCKFWLKRKTLNDVGVSSTFILTQTNYENVVAVLTKHVSGKSCFDNNWLNLREGFAARDTRDCKFELSRL